MTVKYTCPKCSRRFADWGAEKLGYKCPHDESCPPGTEDEVIALIRVGAAEGEGAPAAKPSLKRKKAVAAAPIVQEADLITSGEDLDAIEDIDEEEIEEEFTETEETEAEVVASETETTDSVVAETDTVLVEEDEVEDLDFEDNEEASLGEFTDIDET